MIVAPTIDEKTDFLRGITFKPTELIDPSDENAVVCMRTKNIQRDLDQEDLIAVPRHLVRNEDKFLREGDILISTANSWELVGKCTYVPKLPYPATAGGFISVVRAKSGTHPRFLYHWLNAPKTQFVLRHLGRQTTNISNLNVQRFKALEFPSFEYDEQRRIAAILDKADAIRRKREQALALADDLLKSTFLEMFGDPLLNSEGFDEAELGELADIASGLTKGRRLKPATPVRPVPYMRVANVQDGSLDLTEVKTIEATDTEIDKFRLLNGDLLLTEGGDPDKLGRGWVWREELPLSIHQNHIFRVRLNSDVIDPEILMLQIGSRRGKVYFLREAKQTTGIATINKRQLSSYPALLPPSDLQEKFLELSQATRMMRSRIEKALVSADQLFASLSQRAFRGEL